MHIEWLRRVINTLGDVHREPYFDIGERVKIIGGPLTGVEGIISRVNETSRVIVAIAAIKQSFSVQVPAELVEVFDMNNA